MTDNRADTKQNDPLTINYDRNLRTNTTVQEGWFAEFNREDLLRGVKAVSGYELWHYSRRADGEKR